MPGAYWVAPDGLGQTDCDGWAVFCAGAPEGGAGQLVCTCWAGVCCEGDGQLVCDDAP
jgi:hypothetical protein